MKQVTTSLIFAVMMIGSALAMAYADQLGLKEPADERNYGVMIGFMLAWFGNIMPKQGPETNCAQCSPSTGQNMRRFAGWVFVIAGLAHGAVWLAAPLEVANYIAMGIVAGALVLVIGRATVTRAWV